MDRREALRRISLLMGGTLSVSTVAGILGGCKAGPAGIPFTPQTFTPDQNELVITLTELIIPETDTPGAKAARVNEFIDLMITEWYSAEERDRFLAGVAEVDRRAQEAYGNAFIDATPEEQTALLAAMEEEAIDWAEAVAAGTTGAQDPPFFNMIKELTLSGYYTSEIGASVELRDMPFGTYDGAVPFEEIGRAWS
ncbi:MAG: gluconate 2-dehydrogenase subunit 3 family protein [Rhodothermales bacterium]